MSNFVTNTTMITYQVYLRVCLVGEVFPFSISERSCKSTKDDDEKDSGGNMGVKDLRV